MNLNLTPEQKADYDRIRLTVANCIDLINEYQDQLDEAQNECPHFFPPLTEKQIADPWMSDTAYCSACRVAFGWRCKESPDQVCHYDSEDGQIELIDGRTVPIPANHNPHYETDDSCIFCGMPDERK